MVMSSSLTWHLNRFKCHEGKKNITQRIDPDTEIVGAKVRAKTEHGVPGKYIRVAEAMR